MVDKQAKAESEQPILPEDVPVTMPQLPPTLTVNSAQQFKAIGDRLRWRILDIIQSRPATAKQIADLFKVSPGTIGHHLQVLEEAGLAQVMARRLVHGIVAKYYTRTARVYIFDFAPEIKGTISVSADMLTGARDQMLEATAEGIVDEANTCGFPHARISASKALEFSRRLNELINEFVDEEPDSSGAVYGMTVALFKAPSYLQPDTEINTQSEE